MTIGDRIKTARLAAGMTQTQLGQAIGVNKEAVHKYEKGLVSNIPLERFRALCDVLGLDCAEILCERGRELASKNATSVSQPTDIDTPVTRIYNKLNADGQREYIRYGNYLCSQEEYLADENEPAPVEYIRHYFTAAAAGYAAPIEGEDYELVPKDAKTPAHADFCIDIAGDSMEPYIHDGQRVYVSRDTNNMRAFDVGIFFVDGDVFCKQWCVDYVGTLHLLSANPRREDANLHIAKDSARSVVCFGKVITKRLPAPTYR